VPRKVRSVIPGGRRSDEPHAGAAEQPALTSARTIRGDEIHTTDTLRPTVGRGDEAESASVERDRAVTVHLAIQDLAPSFGESVRVVALQFDAGDLGDDIGSYVVSPVRTGRRPFGGRVGPVERENGAADISGVEVDSGPRPERRFPCDPHTELRHPLTMWGEVVDLDDDHVAAVAAAPVEIAAGGGVWAHGRYDLEEGVADGHHRVLEAEHGDLGVSVTDLQSQHAGDLRDLGVEPVGDEGNLAQLHRGILSGVWHRLRHLLHRHSHGHRHDTEHVVDSGLESSARGIRALKLSLVGLGVTAAAQAVIVVVSGSVALLSDTLHNAADALTALPLWLAFTLGRRPPTRRLTYGLGRAEDVAGVVVVLVIFASAAYALYEAIDALMDPRDITALPAVAIAGGIGFLGNEAVARYRIHVGREIGSASLVADGLHARTDGFTSLGVLAGAGGVALGWDAADAWAGLLIGILILMVLRDAARQVLGRLVDAVEPATVDEAERVIAEVPDVMSVNEVRMRWIGHRLRAEVRVAVDAQLTVADAHDVAERVEHDLLHALPYLRAAIVHVDPYGADGDPHEATAHHREQH